MKKLLLLTLGVIFILSGCSKPATQNTFQNPLLPKSGPDPWAIFYNGNYYYIRSQGNLIVLAATPDITDIKNAPVKVVYDPTDPSCSKDVWAPEIHRIDGKWYIYFAADDGNTDNHQLYVLENSSEDPMEGEFVMKGRISTDPDNNWAIDGSVFELGDELYMVWSGWQTRRVDTETQCIYIARMANPWTLASERVLISRPDLEWERHWVNENGWTPSYTIYVNEGPQPLLSPDGKLVHIAYSASGCWTPYYALGLLTASATADLLDPSSWKKSDQPVFRQKPEAGVYGTGHNSFFKSPDGTEDYIFYHARSTETDPEGAGDTRSPRIQKFTWDSKGYPVFGEPFRVDTVLQKPSGTPVATSKPWMPVGDRIKSRWAANVTPDNVLPEYPRMQMRRSEWKNLNGLWDYAIRRDVEGVPLKYDGQILVPFALESSLSGVGRNLPYLCDLWYHRTFEIPSTWKGKDVILHFGAVDWSAEVFVNGQLAGVHQGGYTPFSINITPYLKKGKQELIVRVVDPCDRSFCPRGKQVSHPEGIWYTSVSGIWQTVWMEPVAQNHITSVIPEADIDAGILTVNVSVADASGEVSVKLMFRGTLIDETTVNAGEAAIFKVQNPVLWSPDTPALYDMAICLATNGKVIDEVESYAAMRKISVGEDAAGHKRMQLNNKNLFQFGPLDQGWWPDGLYTAPTDEALRYDIEQTKKFGFNMIRKHVKVEPDRWYYWCDVLGMLVWQDMPSGDLGNQWDDQHFMGGTDATRTSASSDNYFHEWGDIIDFGRSHPCIVVWVPFNEAWGQFETEYVTEWTKTRDPHRLVNPASGGNFRHCGDILDLHRYPAPDMRLIDPERVLVQGEYGGIGCSIEGHLWWDKRNWGYIRLATEEEVTAQYMEYARMFFDLIPEGMSAAVYTQTTDVEGEVNGLMTYDREINKLNMDSVRIINQQVINKLK